MIHYHTLLPLLLHPGSPWLSDTLVCHPAVQHSRLNSGFGTAGTVAPHMPRDILYDMFLSRHPCQIQPNLLGLSPASEMTHLASPPPPPSTETGKLHHTCWVLYDGGYRRVARAGIQLTAGGTALADAVPNINSLFGETGEGLEITIGGYVDRFAHILLGPSNGLRIPSS